MEFIENIVSKVLNLVTKNMLERNFIKHNAEAVMPRVQTYRV